MLQRLSGSRTWVRRPDLVEQLTEDAYLTDGERLFRCVEDPGAMLMLEDCRTLELILCSREEIARTEMRLVKAGRPCVPEGTLEQISARL